MINKKFGKDLFLVVLSNGAKLLSSILTVFIIPLIFTQQDYGFYKLFLLYLSYVGIFHFGFNDGIYLYYAGHEYEQLDKKKFRTYTKFIIIIQAIFAILIILISLFLSGDRKIIILLVGVNLFILNLTTYYQFISQITQRFKEFAFRNVVVTISNLILIVFFYLFQIRDYKYFLYISAIINAFLLLWYVFTYWEITFGKKNEFKEERDSIVLMFKLGIVLLLSNLIVLFFSTIPRQFVEINFPIESFPEVFSNFSFAYTLMGFTGVFLGAVSMVLYPTLNRSSDLERRKQYSNLIFIILILVSLLISAFYPMSFIVSKFLPDYISSLDIFFIMAPGISITSAVSVIIHNYFKSINKNKDFLIIGIINLAVLIALIYIIFTFISKNVLYIAAATVFAQLLWFLSLDIYMRKIYNILSMKNFYFILASSSLFYATNFIDSLVMAFIFYIISTLIIAIIFYGKELKSIFKEIKITKMNKNQ